MIFTIHVGVSLFLETSIYWFMFSTHGLGCWFGAFGGLGFGSGKQQSLSLGGSQESKPPGPKPTTQTISWCFVSANKNVFFLLKSQIVHWECEEKKQHVFFNFLGWRCTQKLSESWWKLECCEKNLHALFFKVHLHPGRFTWNLQITHLERKMIFQTSMIMFHVYLQGVYTGTEI